MVIMLPTGVTPPTDWTSVTDWQNVLANDNTDNTRGKYFRVMGSVEEPTEQVAEVVEGAEIVTMREYTLEGAVNGLSDEIRNYLVSMQCDPRNYSLWFYDVEGYLYGGSTGIEVYHTNSRFSHPRGRGNYTQATFISKWRSKCEAPRAYVPNLMDNLASLTSTSTAFGFGTGVFGSATNLFGQ